MTRILVIEDEALLREEIALWLIQEGYDVIEAADGMAGVESAQRQTPDLVVCDIMMPRLDGYGVLLELRANPVTTQVPFIFLTAKATHSDIRQGMVLGADDYISRPFTRLELLDAVRARLETSARAAQKYLRDLAELQQALRQEREQRILKAKMVAVFSHDFRNPLAAILSANDLLRHYGERIDLQRRQLHMERIHMAGHQLLQMVEDMLVVAQMEAGRYELDPAPISLTPFLQTIVEEFQALNGEKYKFVLESTLEGNVIADQRLMRQISANLITNAVKYSPNGGEIRITITKVSAAEYALVVEDNGIGIAESEQARLWEAFQRGSNTQDIPGTGVGLFIVKQAAEMLHGHVEVESAVGVGTTMRVVMPIANH